MTGRRRRLQLHQHTRHFMPRGVNKASYQRCLALRRQRSQAAKRFTCLLRAHGRVLADGEAHSAILLSARATIVAVLRRVTLRPTKHWSPARTRDARSRIPAANVRMYRAPEICKRHAESARRCASWGTLGGAHRLLQQEGVAVAAAAVVVHALAGRAGSHRRGGVVHVARRPLGAARDLQQITDLAKMFLT